MSGDIPSRGNGLPITAEYVSMRPARITFVVEARLVLVYR